MPDNAMPGPGAVKPAADPTAAGAPVTAKTPVKHGEEIFAKSVDPRVLMRFFGFLRPYRTTIIISVVAVLVFTLTQIAVPLVIRYIIDKTQSALRLPNGNTLITVNNETAWRPGMTPDSWAPVQVIEVTPAKKIVWALRDWNNLGAVTTIQLLDDPRIKENLHFGSVK